MRRINPNRVKLHRSYRIGEAAVTLGRHKNTVANWLRHGLQAIDNVKPILIHGTELRRFLEERRCRRKSPCGPDQLWCLRCRAPRRPDGGLVDFSTLTPSGGNLCGLCPICGSAMHRRVSHSQLSSLVSVFEIAFAKDQSRINDCPSPSLNSAIGDSFT